MVLWAAGRSVTRDKDLFNLNGACKRVRAGPAAPPCSSASHTSLAAVTTAAAISPKVIGLKLDCIIDGHNIMLAAATRERKMRVSAFPHLLQLMAATL